MYKTRIADWPEDDRPREKLIKSGGDALSDAELLAIILRVGTRQFSALDLARHILKTAGGFRGIDRMDAIDMTAIDGIGLAKAAQIKAAITIGKRLARQQNPQRDQINSSDDAHDIVSLKYRDLKREVFGALFLTARNKLIQEKVLFHGSLTESMVSLREVVREIIQVGAANVIFFHNHPSGEPGPSAADRDITHKLVHACETIEVTVLDHIIIGANSYYSFADNNCLN